jgi:hypothetical protein
MDAALIKQLTTDKLVAGSALIGTGLIDDLAVSTSKIDDLAVSTLKIANRAVTFPTYVSLDENVGISWDTFQSNRDWREVYSMQIETGGGGIILMYGPLLYGWTLDSYDLQVGQSYSPDNITYTGPTPYGQFVEYGGYPLYRMRVDDQVITTGEFSGFNYVYIDSAGKNTVTVSFEVKWWVVVNVITDESGTFQPYWPPFKGSSYLKSGTRILSMGVKR